MIEKTTRWGILCLLLVAGLGSSSWAGITNGQFNSGGTGWTEVEGAAEFGYGTAAFMKSDSESAEINRIQQAFTVDGDWLYFDIQMNAGISHETDTFTATLYDQNNNPFNAYSGTEDYFFLMNNHETGYQLASSGVEVNELSPDIISSDEVERSRNVRMNVAGLMGQTARIEFAGVFNFNEDVFANFNLDNVGPPNAIPTVPAPGALGLAMLGLSVVAWGRKRFLL